MTGHASNITIKDECPPGGDPNEYAWYKDLSLYYGRNGQLLTAIWDQWQVDGEEAFTDYTLLRRRDFVYDGPRELVDTQDCSNRPVNRVFNPPAHPCRMSPLTNGGWHGERHGAGLAEGSEVAAVVAGPGGERVVGAGLVPAARAA